MKPHKLIEKPVTKAYQKDLKRLADILQNLSEFVKNRQVVDCSFVSHHDINHVNKILKTNLDYKKVTSVSYIIEDKRNAKKIGNALFTLSQLIKNNTAATEDDSRLFRSLYVVGIDIFEISMSSTEFDKQSEFIVYHGLDHYHQMLTIEHGTTRFYLMTYQYGVMNKSDKRRYEIALKKHEKQQSEIRKKAAKKAAQTRKKNRILREKREREEQERQKKIKAEKEKWTSERLALTADIVNELQQQINDYIQKNPDTTLFIDTETNSLGDYRQAIEIAIIDENENTVLDIRCDDFDLIIDSSSERVHKITKDDLLDKISLRFIEQDLQQLFKDRTLVFYNADFDISSIKNSLSDDFKFKANRVIDVMQDFAPIYGEWIDWAWSYKWQTLATACKYYNIEHNNAHNALADAIATAKVYKKMSVSNS